MTAIGETAREWYEADQAERASMYDEAEERGISVRAVAYERAKADAERRSAEAERVAAIVNDPAMLKALKAYWAPRPIAPDGSVAPRPPNPLAPPAAPEPRDPNAPPRSGRSINPPRRR